MVFFEADRAVNPVVATILMVGIVVILSAAIGTFVVGLGGDLGGDAQAGVDFQDVTKGGDDGSITIVARSLDRAEYVQVTATVESGDNVTHAGNGPAGELTTRLDEPGDAATFEEDRSTAGDTEVRILAIAVDGDGEAVVMNRVVTI